MATGSHLKIKKMGDNVLGVRLEGNRQKPEPIYFRTCFPGGDVDVVRTSDGEYWVHVRINHPEDGADPNRVMGELVHARLDIIGKATYRNDVGDFNDPNLYHVAFRVKQREE